jgi:predicted phage terminase large subunit-like protein
MGEDYNERCWILDIVRGQWNTFKREEIIKMTAAKDSPQVPIVIEQEPGSGGKESAEYTIRRLAGFRVRADRPTGDKVARAVPYSSQVNGGNVYLIPAIWNSEYINELQYFPKSKYKDQIDASSGAFNELFGKNIRAGAI